MYAIVNNQGKIEVFLNENDVCSVCKNRYKCPLIQAISKEYVFLHYEEVEISQCGLLRK